MVNILRHLSTLTITCPPIAYLITSLLVTNQCWAILTHCLKMASILGLVLSENCHENLLCGFHWR